MSRILYAALACAAIACGVSAENTEVPRHHTRDMSERPAGARGGHTRRDIWEQLTPAEQERVQRSMTMITRLREENRYPWEKHSSETDEVYQARMKEQEVIRSIMRKAAEASRDKKIANGESFRIRGGVELFANNNRNLRTFTNADGTIATDNNIAFDNSMHAQPTFINHGPEPGFGAPHPGFGAPGPHPGFGGPQPGFGAPHPGFGGPQPGFGAPGPHPGFGGPQPGFGGEFAPVNDAVPMETLYAYRPANTFQFGGPPQPGFGGPGFGGPGPQPGFGGPLEGPPFGGPGFGGPGFGGPGPQPGFFPANNGPVFEGNFPAEGHTGDLHVDHTHDTLSRYNAYHTMQFGPPGPGGPPPGPGGPPGPPPGPGGPPPGPPGPGFGGPFDGPAPGPFI